ncbi:MAG: DegT/DnrJ/EryC1/StrS family aminotransferase [Desulfobulbus sp.]|jgi:dTDP-4-amino-4,6-dideoxygalactose transaminase
MKVPLLDLQPQLEQLRPRILAAFTRVLDSTGYILGPEVSGLEERIAAYCGTSFGVGLSSGTDALLAALMALDIGHDDLVLTTPYSFFATMGVVLRQGALPVFVDIDPHSFNMDAEQAEAVLAADRKNGRKIKAILPVHLYGQCADMQKITALAAEFEIPVVEDAAQAIGAEYPYMQDGKAQWYRAGSMGLCGCFSFFPSKNLGCIGDGGMLTTSDDRFAGLVRSIRNHGAEPKYYHQRVGGNFRLDAVQAAILAVKLECLEQWHQQRADNAAIYRQLFAAAGLSDDPVALPKELYAEVEGAQEHRHHIYNQFVIRVPERDALRQHLQAQQIGCEVYYPLCLHQQECLPVQVSRNQHFNEAEKAAASTLALPIYPGLHKEQIAYVVEEIKNFYRQGG